MELTPGVNHGTDSWSKSLNWLLEKNIELVLGEKHRTRPWSKSWDYSWSKTWN